MPARALECEVTVGEVTFFQIKRHYSVRLVALEYEVRVVAIAV